MKKILLFLIGYSFAVVSFGQNTSLDQSKLQGQQISTDSLDSNQTINADTSLQVKKARDLQLPTFFTKEFYAYKNGYPNPKASLFLSFALPGTGQIYNRKYWKAPIIYAGLGGMVYLLEDSSSKYVAYRNAYKRSISEGSATFESPLVEANLSSAALKIQRDKYEKRRTLSYVGTIAIYGLFALEAFVDAHLQSFDVSKDLSLKVSPSIQEHYSMPGLGLVIQVK